MQVLLLFYLIWWKLSLFLWQSLITDSDRIYLKQIVLFEFPRDFSEQMKIKIDTAHNN